jgi:hypothetical protein
LDRDDPLAARKPVVTRTIEKDFEWLVIKDPFAAFAVAKA